MNIFGVLITLISIAEGVLYVLILARILISWLPVSPWHPVVRWLRIIVDPILRPFRRLLPTLAGIDLSPLLAILVIIFVGTLATQILSALELGGSVPVGADVVSAVGQLLLNILIVLGVLVLIRFLISLFSASPWHPLVVGIRTMTDPLVRPFAHLGPRRSAYGYQSARIDLPALLTLGTYILLYIAITIVFERILPAVF
jgi:YggT family protein